MTLRELLSHFKNKTTWVDICTPLWSKHGELKHIEKELTEDLLDTKVTNWNYTNALTIEMIPMKVRKHKGD